MGTTQHHAIVVTASSLEQAHDLHRRASEIFSEQSLTRVHLAPHNGYASFVVLPDGSKEGWLPSNEYDEKRRKFVEILRKRSYCFWAEVTFGEYGVEVVNKPHDEEGDEDSAGELVEEDDSFYDNDEDLDEE